MTVYWEAHDTRDGSAGAVEQPTPRTDPPVRKEQITVRLDPGMIADARQVAARKGIGYHTLLRMWVMEGITRAYQEGLLDAPPQSWSPQARRAARAAAPAVGHSVAEPSGARWARSGRRMRDEG
jgi:hypothetical protein